MALYTSQVPKTFLKAGRRREGKQVSSSSGTKPRQSVQLTKEAHLSSCTASGVQNPNTKPLKKGDSDRQAESKVSCGTSAVLAAVGRGCFATRAYSQAHLQRQPGVCRGGGGPLHRAFSKLGLEQEDKNRRRGEWGGMRGTPLVESSGLQRAESSSSGQVKDLLVSNRRGGGGPLKPQGPDTHLYSHSKPLGI